MRVGEEAVLLGILESALGVFHNDTDARNFLSSRRFDRDGCFIADVAGSPVGSVAVTPLPRDNWFVIRYLGVGPIENKAAIADALLGKALDYTKSKGVEFVRATTPAIQPYVDLYKKHGFVAVRRDFRISWDNSKPSPREETQLKLEEVSEANSEDATQAFVRSLSPYWDWRTQEQGGPVPVGDSFREGLKRGEKWFLCRKEGDIVGLTGIIPDYYRQGQSRFRGAYVLPKHRGKGIGLGLMKEALALAWERGQQHMIVYTFSDLDCLAPGALLYLRSGGRIEAEYTQLTHPDQ